MSAPPAASARRSRIIVGITGASGSIYGITLLRLLRERGDVETHLVLSRSGIITMREETDIAVDDVKALADVVHPFANIGATIASGSFPCDGMVIAPCSIKTLSAIAHCYTDDLISRAADVTLKEGRPLVLLVRESPLHVGHLRTMLAAAEAGAVIAPPVPAFYNRPASLDDMVEHTCRRTIERLGLGPSSTAWAGLSPATAAVVDTGADSPLD